MKLRIAIAAGMGLTACLCLAIAATTAQQTEERKPYTIHRVTGNDLSAVGQQPANALQASPGFRGVPLDGVPRLMAQPGPQRVVVSDAFDPLRGEVPGPCGDTTLTQNNDPDTVLINGATIACQQGGATVENAWASSSQLTGMTPRKESSRFTTPNSLLNMFTQRIAAAAPVNRDGK